MISYYIIKTAPQQERKLWTKLIELGYQSFLPVETKHQRRGDGSHTRKREYPMFIRYAFLGCEDIDSAWCRLRADDKVYPKMLQGHGPLGMGGRPYRLPAADVAHLLTLCGRSVPYGNSVNPHRAALAVVRQGQRAEIMAGPLAGHKGAVARVDGKKATVLLELFNSLQEVQISVAALEAVG